MREMSRLRRPTLSERFFFISCRVLPPRGPLSEGEFAFLATREHGFEPKNEPQSLCETLRYRAVEYGPDANVSAIRLAGMD